MVSGGRLLTSGSDCPTAPGWGPNGPGQPGSLLGVWRSAVISPSSPSSRSPREGASSVRSTVGATSPQTSSCSVSSKTGEVSWVVGHMELRPRVGRTAHPTPGPQAGVRGSEPEEGGEGAGLPGGHEAAGVAAREGERRRLLTEGACQQEPWSVALPPLLPTCAPRVRLTWF